MSWAPHVRIATADCRPMDGQARGHLDGDLVYLAPSGDPEWLRATVRYFPSGTAPAPDYLRCLVRRSALPADALRLLGPEVARAQP